MIHSPINTRSAGGIIFNNKGEVAIVSQRGTSWSLPKGHIEEGEDALTAAKREIYEETGLTQLDYIKEVGSYSRYKIGKDGKDDMSEMKTITLFLFRTNETVLKPVDSDNPVAEWVDPSKAAEMLTHAKDAEFVFSVLKDIQ